MLSEHLNNNITEDRCSFEVSKLLKQKGFTVPTLCYYFEDGEFNQNFIKDTFGYYGTEYTVEFTELLNNWNDNFLTKKNGDRCFGCNKNKGYFETYSSPTHATAIKWIRENFGLHIFAQQMWYKKNSEIAFFYLIYENPEKEVGNHEDIFSEILQEAHQEVKGNYINDEKFDKLIFEKSFAFKTPEEAIEAALLYTLQNLTK